MLGPLRDRPTSDELLHAGGKIPEVDLITALRGTLPFDIPDEKIKRIAKAVISKVPSISTSLATTLIPIIMLDQPDEKEEGLLKSNLISFALMTALTVTLTSIIRHKVFNYPQSAKFGEDKKIEFQHERTHFDATKLEALKN